jgi:hypothetical protein
MITNNSKPFPFVQILTLTLVVAKIAGWVQFSWWIVFSPILVTFVLLMLLEWLIIFIIKKGL